MPMTDLPLDQLRTYRGTNPRPQDFDTYWAQALAELDGVDPLPQLAPAAFQAEIAQCYDLTFRGVRDGEIYAQYLRPRTPGPHPCVLLFHGYTMNSGDWSAKLALVSQGFCVAAMDCRGQGGKSRDPGGVSGNTYKGQIIRGLQDGPQDLLFRHIFLDTVQLTRVVSSLDEVDPARLGAMGESQGGALCVACSALSGQIARSVVQYPFLSDFQRVWNMGLGGNAYSELYDYFRRFDPLHEREADTFLRLGYIDVHHLAPWVRNPVLMASGLDDKTCPASTHFAVYNNLGTQDKELKVYPDYGHEYLPGWADLAFAFLSQLRR